jgi:hypothetical protein
VGESRLVYVLRMAVFPIVQTGRTIVHQGWTARAIFLFSFVVAFLLFRSRTEKTESPPGGMVVESAGLSRGEHCPVICLNLLLDSATPSLAIGACWSRWPPASTFTLELCRQGARGMFSCFRGGSKE